MKRSVFALISLFLGIILLFGLLKHIGWQEIKSTLLKVSILEIFYLLFLGFIYSILGSLRWREILNSQGYKFSIKEIYERDLAASSITYLVPQIPFGAEVFKGYILNSKGKNSASLEKGLTGVFIDGIFEYATQWVLITLGVISGIFILALPFKNFQIVAFVLALSLIGFFIYNLFSRKESMIKMFFKVDEENKVRLIEKEIMSFFNIKNPTFQKAFLFSFATGLVKLFQYWTIVEFFGKSIPLSTAFTIVGLSIIFMGAPVGADLGTLDFGSALLFKQLGLGEGVGVAFALMVRLNNLTFGLLGVLCLIKLSLVELRHKIVEKIGKIFN